MVYSTDIFADFSTLINLFRLVYGIFHYITKLNLLKIMIIIENYAKLFDLKSKFWDYLPFGT
jgi:hypothetical protein